jgi:UDP-glucose 4-epimerase
VWESTHQNDSAVLVTGGAGFIGSHLVDRLLSQGFETHVLDNLSNGKIEYIRNWERNRRFKFYNLDLIDSGSLDRLPNYRIVYHLANPEVMVNITDLEVHLNQNIAIIFNLLEALRKWDTEVFIFTSSSTVYGDATKIPTPEDYSPLEPISPYGVSKLACEALISRAASSYGFEAIIYRLANIIGANSTHGVIYDFVNKLHRDPSQLEILGDGTQRKSYMLVSDCMEAMQFGLNNSNGTGEIYNVSSEDHIDVYTIAKIVIQEMGLSDVRVRTTGGVDGGRGWKGDVKTMSLDISKLKSLGWKPRYDSLQAVKIAAKLMINGYNRSPDSFEHNKVPIDFAHELPSE